jgi:hypothetical protein
MKWTIELGSITYQTTWKTIEKCVRAQFIIVWNPLVVVKMGHHFHHNFQACLWADLHMYMGMNLGCTTWVQQHVRL